MTAPLPQPALQSVPQQPTPDTATAEIAALLAALLAAGTAAAATAAARRALLATYEAGRIVALLAGLGIDRDVATVVLSMTLTRSPLPNTRRVAPGSSPARRQTQLVNLTRRAAYVVNAAKRVQNGLDETPPSGRSDVPTVPAPTAPTPMGPEPTPRPSPTAPTPSGQPRDLAPVVPLQPWTTPSLTPRRPGRHRLPDVGPPPDTVWDAEQRRRRMRDELKRERRAWEQHAKAAAARNRVAREVDELAAVHGDVLRWSSTLDQRTSPFCRAADGRLFRASRMPALSWPGTVHPACRCRAAAPGFIHRTDRWVYDVNPSLEDH